MEDNYDHELQVGFPKYAKNLFNKNGSDLWITFVVPVTVHVYKNDYLLSFNHRGSYETENLGILLNHRISKC